MEILDLVPAPAATAFVREVPLPAAWFLNRFLPDVRIDDIEATIDQVTRKNRAASFRTFDAESPIGQRPEFSRNRVTLPPISEKIPLGEHERLQLERARSGNADTARLVDQVFNDAENLSRSIDARMELARGDVLTDGKFTLADENGLTLEADFGLPADHLVAPTALWSDSASATPISDLETWAGQYEDVNGERPGFIVMSRRARSYVLGSAEAKALAGFTTGGPVATLDATRLNQLLEARDLPQIVVYSARINVNDVDVRPISEDRVVFLPADPRSLGYTAWGITAESLEFFNNPTANPGQTAMEFDQLTGKFASVLKEFDPVRTWTKVAATGMPTRRC